MALVLSPTDLPGAADQAAGWVASLEAARVPAPPVPTLRDAHEARLRSVQARIAREASDLAAGTDAELAADPEIARLLDGISRIAWHARYGSVDRAIANAHVVSQRLAHMAVGQLALPPVDLA
jgi:hypothetical protein